MKNSFTALISTIFIITICISSNYHLSIFPLSSDEKDTIITAKGNTTTRISKLHLDFESGLDNWDLVDCRESSSIEIVDNYSYSGNCSVKLTGTARYRYNITKNFGSSIKFTTSTKLSFAWRFDNKDAYYTGIIIVTPAGQPYVYVISHFNAYYGNISQYRIIQYDHEEISTWHYHTVNLSRVFLEAYGYNPDCILAIDIVNIKHLGGEVVATNQISYFDSIKVWNEDSSLFSFIFDYFVSGPEIDILIVLCLFAIKRKVKYR
ncbi:MAG: hypothetical protein ACTSP4_15340 [Candidatus Hodarchaeales archaeon]